MKLAQMLIDVTSARLHVYGKRDPRRARKMGHLTALADTPEAAAALVREARTALTGSHVRA